MDIYGFKISTHPLETANLMNEIDINQVRKIIKCETIDNLLEKSYNYPVAEMCRPSATLKELQENLTRSLPETLSVVFFMSGLWGRVARRKKKTRKKFKSPQSLCQNVLWSDKTKKG